ncbi:Hypothetical predicted protein [Mytilus galloprovincialis]|uniref:Uncharacterized protein n=1 Tax=Mytilus galloprovincialis TaxID=29158 RepID=A0A8B6C2W5_MYTGA|nr:Hypothetical predicted protein [Mytilus galloprovincialis]
MSYESYKVSCKSRRKYRAHIQGQIKMLGHELKGKAEIGAHGMVQGSMKHSDMHQELSVGNTKVAKHTYHEFTAEGKAEGKAKCNVAANSGKRVFNMVAEIEGRTKGKVQFCVGKANYEKTPNSCKGNVKAIQLKASGEANIEGSVNINSKSKRTGKLSTLTKDSTAAELKLGNVSATGLDERKSSKVVSSTIKTGARANILNADVKGAFNFGIPFMSGGGGGGGGGKGGDVKDDSDGCEGHGVEW